MSGAEVVTRFFALLNERDLDGAHALLAEDFIERDALVVKRRGRAEHRRFVEAIFDAFPDLLYEVRATVEDGDGVAAYWVATGTHGGEYAGRPRTQRAVTMWGWWMGRVTDGSMVESYGGWDKAALLDQLDADPGS